MDKNETSFQCYKNISCQYTRKYITNFEIQKYQNESKFNGVYSRNNLSKIKDWAYIINLDEYQLIGTHWIALYVIDNNLTYFDSFRV